MSKIHAREGFCFERQEDGGVRVSKVLYGRSIDPHKAADEVTAYVTTIPPNEWASVVAHVSQHGDTGDACREALAFHGEPVAQAS